MPASSSTPTIAWFADLSLADIDQVGGKNASLGEMVRNLTSVGVRVPDGFATTADAYRQFISEGGLDEMVKALISSAIKACKSRGKYVGICGQGPSDHPDFAEWLLEQSIDSISLNPDTVVDTWIRLGIGAQQAGVS